jgi:hypothetical protein
MYTLQVDIDIVMTDVPTAANNLLLNINESVDISDIKWYYTFVVDDIENNIENKVNMSFKNRLEYELKYTKCQLYLNTPIFTLYCDLNILPNRIVDIVTEYVKLLMQEQKNLTNEQIETLINDGIFEYDIDIILEKIFQYNLDSLTEFEKMFLKNYSNSI